MTQLTFAITDDIVQRAIEACKPTTHRTDGPAALNAAGGDILDVSVKDVYLRLTDLVTRCARDGFDLAKEEVGAFLDFVTERSAELGARAERFRELIQEKVRQLIASMFDLVLQAFRAEVSIGGRAFVLDTVQLEQKLIYSGSLKASLNELCSFVGGGEVVVTGSYKLTRSQ